MSTKRPGQKITMTSLDELLCVPETDGTIDIEVDAIYPFENHPYRVVDDEKMDELVESIKTSGVLTQVLVRPDNEGSYEMISGHRRLHAAKRAGLRKIPAIVKEFTDDEATIAMVDANVQREEVLPSEKAFAFRMKLEAIKRQGMRRELTSLQNGGKLDDASRNKGRRLEAADIIGQSVGTSGTQVQRLVRLTELIPRLLQMVDKKRLAVSVGVELSFLSKGMQQWIYEYIKENGMIRQEQLMVLRNYREDNSMTQEKLIELLNKCISTLSASKKIVLSERKLRNIFRHIIQRLRWSGSLQVYWNSGRILRREKQMNEIIKMKSDYFYKTQVNQFSFIRIPKELVTGEMFSSLSIPSKILYGMMLDRMSMSGRNKWLDGNNRTYIIYPVKDMQVDMNISKRKASDYLKELEDIGLIKRKKQGKGLPNHIYVMNFAAVNQ